MGVGRLIAPPKKTSLKPPPKLKPSHAPRIEGSLDQLQRSVGELDRLGIGLPPPKEEDLKRLIDKQKNQVTVPRRSVPDNRGSSWPSPPCGWPTAARINKRPPSRR